MGVVSNFLSPKCHVTSLELNYGFNSNNGFTNSGANVHMCADKNLFSLYQETNTCTISMGSGSIAHVLGEGQVKLELLSRNYLVLKGVFHVSKIR